MDVAILLAVLLLITYVAWRRGARLLAAGCGLFALLPILTLLRQLPWPAYAAATAMVGMAGWHRYARSAGVVTRWSARNRRSAGVASTIDLARKASVRALRRRATVVRPSLAGTSRWTRYRVSGASIGLELCRAGFVRVWCLIEDVVIVIGGPRVGKSGFLASRILDFPGAAVVTSTRTDLLTLCGSQRERTRGPVYVFNAVGLGGIPSTITFDPLTGCTDPVTATERATDLLAAVSRGGSGDREFWDAQARRVLAALLHAAALGGRSVEDVQLWVSKPARAAKDVPALLRRSGVAAFVEDAEQFIGTNDRTQTSITTTVIGALGWLSHPTAAAAAQPGRGFDVAQLLRERATVFLLGAEETQAAPLVTALTGHIAREARRLAAHEPAGRLDPPLGLFLDEAALISPVPLESWSADMGGRGVTIVAAFQSRSQLLARWGEHNAATILNNTGAVVLFGGTRDRDDLLFWSTLAGERDEPITTTDLHGRVASRTVRKVPVVPPAQIANLPAGRVLVIRRGIGPVLGKATMAWQRRDVRAAAWRERHPALVKRVTAMADWTRERWTAARQSVRIRAVLAYDRLAALLRGGRAWLIRTWAALVVVLAAVRARFARPRTTTDGASRDTPHLAAVVNTAIRPESGCGPARRWLSVDDWLANRQGASPRYYRPEPEPLSPPDGPVELNGTGAGGPVVPTRSVNGAQPDDEQGESGRPT